MRSLFTRLAALSVVAIAVAGCAGSSGTALPAVGAPNTGGGAGQFVSNSTGTAAVRFVHGSPDAGKVDICLDGVVVGSSIAFKTVSAYRAVTAAVPHQIIVNAAGGGCTKTGAVFDVSVTPALNTRNSYVVAGTVAGKSLQVLAFTSPAPPAVGQTQVEFWNASPNAGPAGVSFGTFSAATGTGFTATSAAVLFKGVASLTAAQIVSGNAFYIGYPSAATTPIASLYPGAVPAAPVATANGIDAANTKNVFPYSTTDYLISAFAIDATATGGTIIVGAIDPNNLGF